MKLFAAGLLYKVVSAKDKRFEAKKNGIDNLNLALLTKHSPFKKSIKLNSKSPLDDPDLFISTFQRICQK